MNPQPAPRLARGQTEPCCLYRHARLIGGDMTIVSTATNVTAKSDVRLPRAPCRRIVGIANHQHRPPRAVGARLTPFDDDRARKNPLRLLRPIMKLQPRKLDHLR